MQNEIAEQLSLNLFSNLGMNNATHAEIIKMPDGKPLPNGELILYKNLFSEMESNQFFNELRNTLNWRQDKIKMFGKESNLPRLTAWYGDNDKSYKYSGISMSPQLWTSVLLFIKSRIEGTSKAEFNSVLVNLYRDGKDYVSWHSDDEQELGKNPTIASVSFGETRRFQLKYKSQKDLDKVEILLTNGSLLLMKGSTQHFWQHQIPKSSKQLKERINLTFRYIY
jgi:alkylated DNA repair dioxygenase AlkB